MEIVPLTEHQDFIDFLSRNFRARILKSKNFFFVSFVVNSTLNIHTNPLSNMSVGSERPSIHEMLKVSEEKKSRVYSI